MGAYKPFWAFRVGGYSRRALIRRWAVNRINTVIHILCKWNNITAKGKFIGPKFQLVQLVFFRARVTTRKTNGS